MTKNELRKIYKQKRLALSAGERSKLEDLILIRFQQLGIEIPDCIMTYAPFEKMGEFDPQLITDYCYFKNPGQKLFYPVMDAKNGTMQAVQVNEDTYFTKNEYGIGEPADGAPAPAQELDLIIVPLLAYDTNGHRVGYGKGYYDRFLNQCRKDVVKIGFSFFTAEEG